MKKIKRIKLNVERLEDQQIRSSDKREIGIVDSSKDEDDDFEIIFGNYYFSFFIACLISFINNFENLFSF